MGSDFCKAGPGSQQVGNIRDIPQLSRPIELYLQKQSKCLLKNLEPFQKQIQHSKKIIKRCQDGTYHGPINLVSLFLTQFNKPAGYGKLYKKDKSLYVGHFQNGKADGPGTYITHDGSYFKGTFSKNMLIQGQYHTQHLSYEGKFQNNLFHGLGKQENKKGNFYFEGQYKQGRRVEGSLRWIKQKVEYIYEGKFQENGDFVKQGKLTEQPFGYYVGEFRNNLKHGKGVYEYTNGLKYQGDYKMGQKQGHGVLYNGNGSKSYEGNFEDGLPHGQGQAYDKQGKLIKSQWIQGIDSKLVEG